MKKYLLSISTKTRRIRASVPRAISVSLLLGLAACPAPGTGTFSSSKASTSTTSSTSTSTALSGVKSAQFIFKNTAGSCNPSSPTTCLGSFGTAPSGGTTPGKGNGLAATVVFNPDGSFLAKNTTDTNWPSWISSVEIGITGSSNTYSVSSTTYSSNSNCARFTTATEALATNCNFGTANSSCDGPANGFRVSEVDCVYGTDPNSQGVGSGSGSLTDNVYIRATFNRAALGPNENVMVVVNYAASSYHAPDKNPQDCFHNGAFAPEYCSDFTWKLFLRHTDTETVQPFMVFLPPTYSYVVNNSNASGAVSATRQFILPFAADQNIQTVQLSRMTQPSGTILLQHSDTSFTSACDAGGLSSSGGGNSPLCAGIVFNSITFYRI